MNDKFAHKASNYEKEKRRVDNVVNIANLIKKEINFKKYMSIADFGSGTGLLLEQIAPLVTNITAIDKSPSMNNVLKNKQLPCKLTIKEIDITKEPINDKFDVIISSMTIHHVKEIDKLFTIFYKMLKSNGYIALADLDTEDGSFHIEDTGVEHFGFNREVFLNHAKEAGFKDLKIQNASIVYKPYGNYSVFLLTGKRD